MYELYWIIEIYWNILNYWNWYKKKTNKIITTNEVQNRCDSYDIKEDISKFKW